MAQTKPSVRELKQVLEGIVSATLVSRISALSTALQWYDVAIPYLIGKKLIDATKMSLMNKATKARELGIHEITDDAKENAFMKAIAMLEKVCDAIKPPSVQMYYDQFKAVRAKLEADEQRLGLKHQPVMDLLSAVFKATGFKISIDPKADKARQFSGVDAIVYSRAAMKDMAINLRHEGLMPVVLRELMFFSRAQAIKPDSGTFVYKPELHVKAITALTNDFITFAKEDSSKWKLLRYGATAQSITTTVNTAPSATKVVTPRAPRVGVVGGTRKQPGERYVRGTAMWMLYERLKDGKPVEKKDLFKDVPSNDPEGRLKWIVKHGLEKNEWAVVVKGTTVTMTVNKV